LPQAAADYTKWTIARLRALEQIRAGAEYACADRFTMADISIGFALMLARKIGLGPQIPATLNAYFDRLAARPAYERAKAAQADSPPSVISGSGT
jgi:glutathione S-transferase